MTLRDIVDHSDPIEVLLGLIEHVQGQIGAKGFEALNPAERIVFCVYDLHTETTNGDLYQYLWNSSGDEAVRLSGVLKTIGATHIADVIARAFALLDGPPDPDRGARQEQLEKLDEAGMEALGELTEELWDSEEFLPELLAAYFRAHVDDLEAP